MTVTVVTPRRLVRVDPDPLDADDVIELAAALIDEHGHIKNDSGDASRGWSIHGAVGEAARRATGSSGKDDAAARPFRDEIATRVADAHAGMSEFEVNDTAADKMDAIARLEKARTT